LHSHSFNYAWAQNKYYIQNIKELKTKAKTNYSADPEKKAASEATVLTLRKSRLPLNQSFL